MNPNREKQQRNITPNFLRFKRIPTYKIGTNSGKKNQGSLEPK